jgi:hypothetical protein
VPQVANIVFGGKTPDPGREKLAEMGFSVVLYANAALQAALRASYDVLGALKRDGTLTAVADRLASFEERQRAVAKDRWDALEARTGSAPEGDGMLKRPWDGIISEDEQKAYNAAGFGRAAGLGKRPALLIIDVQYRTVGTRPMPFWEAIKEYPTSCGEVAWEAVSKIEKLLTLFRERNWPVLYPYVAPKQGFDMGRLSDKVPAIMNVAAKGYEFVAPIAPAEADILLALVEEGAEGGSLRRLVEIGILQHQQRGLAAQFEQSRLQLTRRALGDDAPHPRRASEVDAADRRMVDQSTDDIAGRRPCRLGR